MGQKEKLIRRLKSKPRDFTFQEAETLLGYLTYQRFNKGKTSGFPRAVLQRGSRTDFAAQAPPKKRAFGVSGQAAAGGLEQEGLL